MEYNELGQLQRKTLHGETGSGIQEMNYAYNIRGWLERINDPMTNPSSTSYQKFNLGLNYNNPPTGFTVDSMFNGNIAAMAWNTPANTDAKSPADKQGYGFTYDALNRLVSSVYGEGSNFGTNAGVNNENYNFDLNGNIKSLKRYLKGTGMIDNLTYSYKISGVSNLLDRVDDASTTAGFNNGTSQPNEYTYDGNGNLTSDANKGYTSILYNYLNLPRRVGTTSQYISYIYDAAGTKVAKISTGGAYTYYAGNFVYGGSSLNYILTAEGLVLPDNSYKYYLKDHLGSTRMVVNTLGTGGTIEQQTDYYPFGMTIAEFDGSVNPYRYNGKELQEDVINGKKLELYDYGARFYDPVIARWSTPDPLAEWHFNYTPYHYVFDNPINYIDPFGLDTLPPSHVPGEGIVHLDQVTVTAEKTPSSESSYQVIYWGFAFIGNYKGRDNYWIAKHTFDVSWDLMELLFRQSYSKRHIPNRKSIVENEEDTYEKIGLNTKTDKEIMEQSTGTGEKTDRSGRPISDETYIPVGAESDSIIEEVGVYFDEKGPIQFQKQKIHRHTRKGRFITGTYQKDKKK